MDGARVYENQKGIERFIGAVDQHRACRIVLVLAANGANWHSFLKTKGIKPSIQITTLT